MVVESQWLHLQELNSDWENKRRYNTSKGRKTYERLDLTAYKKEEVYSDVFQDGEITPIDDFLIDKGFSPLDFGSTKEKLEFVEQETAFYPLFLQLVFLYYSSRNGFGTL